MTVIQNLLPEKRFDFLEYKIGIFYTSLGIYACLCFPLVFPLWFLTFCGFSVISVLMRVLNYSALEIKNNFLRYLFAWSMKTISHSFYVLEILFHLPFPSLYFLCLY